MWFLFLPESTGKCSNYASSSCAVWFIQCYIGLLNIPDFILHKQTCPRSYRETQRKSLSSSLPVRVVLLQGNLTDPWQDAARLLGEEQLQQFGFRQGEFLTSGQCRMTDWDKDKMAGPAWDYTVWTCLHSHWYGVSSPSNGQPQTRVRLI